MFKMAPLLSQDSVRDRTDPVLKLDPIIIDKKSAEEAEESTNSKGVFKIGNFAKGDMDIFWTDWRAFLPEGKTPEDLTLEDKKALRNKYRFSFLRPGTYQGITGINNSFRGNKGSMLT